jgi:hypothetical protein
MRGRKCYFPTARIAGIEATAGGSYNGFGGSHGQEDTTV